MCHARVVRRRPVRIALSFALVLLLLWCAALCVVVCVVVCVVDCVVDCVVMAIAAATAAAAAAKPWRSVPEKRLARSRRDGVRSGVRSDGTVPERWRENVWRGAVETAFAAAFVAAKPYRSGVGETVVVSKFLRRSDSDAESVAVAGGGDGSRDSWGV